METKIKEVISAFIGIAPADITKVTRVGKSAVKNSILLHRMYSKLSEEGFHVEDYTSINVFEDIIALLNGFDIESQEQISSNTNNLTSPEKNDGVGVDIEEIASFPVVNDFRVDYFYTENFSDSEIAYCILQKNPYASFAGLFAAKESIVKINEKFRRQKFNTLIIKHNQFGKPIFNELIELSISHTDNYVVALAISLPKALPIEYNDETIRIIPDKSSKTYTLIIVLSILSLLVSVITIFLLFSRFKG